MSRRYATRVRHMKGTIGHPDWAAARKQGNGTEGVPWKPCYMAERIRSHHELQLRIYPTLTVWVERRMFGDGSKMTPWEIVDPDQLADQEMRHGMENELRLFAVQHILKGGGR